MRITPLLLAMAALSPPLRAADPSDSTTQSTETLYLAHQLENGLKVSIYADPRLPVVATQHWVDFGAVHEREGQHGFAHLFEHMMFAATSSQPRGEYARFHVRNGGARNGYTSRDCTYYVSIVAPQNHDRVLQLESDRLQNLVIDADEMAKDRLIVTEELRSRRENDPFSRLMVELERQLLGEHPYAHQVLGNKQDVAGATPEDARALYDSWYRPDHLHLVVVGPVDAHRTLARIEELYGDLEPSGAALPTVPALTEWSFPDYLEITEDVPPSTTTALFYPLPPASHPDYWPVRLMLRMLDGDELDRFHEELVTRRNKAMTAWTQSTLMAHGGYLTFASASLPLRRARKAFAHMEAVVEELDRLSWLHDESLSSARRQLLRQELVSVYYADQRAHGIGFAATVQGDARLAFEVEQRLWEVTTDDVARVWRRYLGEATPTRIYVHRGPGGTP